MTDHTQIQKYKKGIQQAFDKAVYSYNSVAVLQRIIGADLLERLNYHAFETLPNCILDIGSGLGYFTSNLLRKFSNSHILHLDVSYKMLLHSKSMQQNALCTYLCADAEQLPIQNNSIDFIFSNCAFQWCFEINKLFIELQRILKPKGLLLFSSFGPDTLKELKLCFSTIDNVPHVNDFLDMHHVGDALLKANFSNVVVDTEKYTLTYHEVLAILKEIKLLGSNFVKNRQDFGLNTSSMLKKLASAYENFRNQENLLPATFEVVYGYALAKDSGKITNPDK